MAYQLIAVTCRISDFLNEPVISPSKYFFSYLYDICSMGFIESKYQGFRKIIHIRLTLWIIEEFCVNHIPISRKNKFYLCRIDDTPIKFLICISFGFLTAYSLNLARISCFFFKFLALQYSSACFCNLRFYSIHPAINIHTINDALLQCIVDNAVIVEECHCFRNRRCSQTHQSCRIEILQHLAPVSINGAMAFVYDNHVKVVMWQIWIRRQRYFFCRFIFVIIFIILNCVPFQE